VPRFNQMTAVAFSDILGFGLGFGGCGLVNITGPFWYCKVLLVTSYI